MYSAIMSRLCDSLAQYNICCSCRRTCAEASADSLELIRQGLKKPKQLPERTRVYCHSFHLSAFRSRQVTVETAELDVTGGKLIIAVYWPYTNQNGQTRGVEEAEKKRTLKAHRAAIASSSSCSKLLRAWLFCVPS